MGNACLSPQWPGSSLVQENTQPFVTPLRLLALTGVGQELSHQSALVSVLARRDVGAGFGTTTSSLCARIAALLRPQQESRLVPPTLPRRFKLKNETNTVQQSSRSSVPA